MPVTGAALLVQISGRAVHRSSDGRDWLRAGGTFADVTAQVAELHAHGLVRLHRNVEGWWGLWRLAGPGEALLRQRAPGRGAYRLVPENSRGNRRPSAPADRERTRS